MEPTKEQKAVLKRLREVDPDLDCQWHPELKIPTRLRGKLSAPARGNPVAIAKQFLTDCRALYGIKEVDRELELRTAKRDKMGGTHIRLRQRWQNIPVFNTELIVHVGPDNMVKGINGEFHPVVDIPTEPKISADEAIAVAKKHAGKTSDIPGQRPKLEIFHKKGEYKLCWHVKFDGFDGDEPALWEYFIDTKKAEVFFRYNNLQSHSSTNGFGRGRYTGCVLLHTYHNHTEGTYQLRDTTRSGIEIKTYDNGSSTNRDLLALSEDSNNRWTAINRNPRHNSQEPEVDCHYYLGKVIDYYLNVHGRSSYDDAGSDAEVCVHFGNNNLGSFWDTTRHRIYHGDGDGVNRDYKSSLDVNAHEFTHGVTQTEVNFNYWGQSGSLCEAYSDFFACMIQTDWFFEEEIFLGATAPNDALRSLYDPTLYGHPDHMNNIGANMHDNSCIVSKAGYLMTHGGTHNGIEVYGLGRSITEQIWYQALQYLQPNSQFADFRDALEDACSDLFPLNTWNRACVQNAMAAVGIGPQVNYPNCPNWQWIDPGIPEIPECLFRIETSACCIRELILEPEPVCQMRSEIGPCAIRNETGGCYTRELILEPVPGCLRGDIIEPAPGPCCVRELIVEPGQQGCMMGDVPLFQQIGCQRETIIIGRLNEVGRVEPLNIKAGGRRQKFSHVRILTQK